jgi:carboxypeptidase Q
MTTISEIPFLATIRARAVILSAAALLVLPLVGCEEPPEGAVPAMDAPAAEVLEVPGAPSALELADLAERALEGSHLSVNADTLLDVIGARVSALPSGDSAQAWVQRRLDSYGVPRVWQDPFPLLAWDRREAELEVVSPTGLVDGPLNILSLGHVGSHEVEAPLVDAGYGTAEEIQALGEDLDGSIVLVNVGAPDGYGRGVHRTEKVTLVTRAGAVGFIQVNTGAGERIPVGVATMGDVETEIPAVAADLASGERLRAGLEEAGEDGLVVRLYVDNWMERTEAANVLGEIPGTSNEVILVGAHLDSWDLAQGAVDNGTGTLAVLDIARALAEHVAETGQVPYRSIRFAFWMGEELGLYGSRAYVDDRLEEDRLDRYAAILNLDVIGSPEGLGAMGRREAEPFLRHVRNALRGSELSLDDELTTSGGLYSDHQPFLMQGVPVLVVRSRQLPEAAGVGHTLDDNRDVIDEPGIARTAAVSAALLWAAANTPDLGLVHWGEEEIGPSLEELGVRDPLERAGEWRWP